MAHASNCHHVSCVSSTVWEDIKRKKQTQDECDTCDSRGPNLWLCLQARCLYVGCGESAEDHSSEHMEEKGHCLTLNMTTFRIWCYSCECEVHKDNNNPPLFASERNLSLAPLSPHMTPEKPTSHHVTPPRSPTPTHEDSDSDSDDDTQKPRGLVGLQNIGNTCYMNSAIQALSNCQPLTRFFMDCPGYVRTDKKPMLSKCYLKLVSEIWHRKRPSYLVPSGVASGIKLVHPMFRGFTQQDSQEFLRCFMDQIHEELKQPISAACNEIPTSDSSAEGDAIPAAESSEDENDKAPNIRRSPQHRQKQAKAPEVQKPQVEPSDGEYETCESGNSSERSSTEPCVAQGEDVAQERNMQEESLRSSASLEVTTPEGLDIMRLAQSGAKIMESKRDDQSVVSMSNTEADSGIGSSRSSTIIRSSSSNLSLASEDAQSIDNWSCGSVQSKTTKELANKQQQQYAQESECNSPVASSSSSLRTSNSSSSLTPTNQDDVDVEFAECADTDATTRYSSSQSRRSKHSGAEAKKPRSRTASERTRQGHSGKSGKKKTQEYQSVISDIFDGKILSSVQCLTCERVSATNENFQDLSLPIPSKDYLHMLHSSHGSSAASNITQNFKGSCGEVHLSQGWFSWMFGWFRSWIWGPTISLRDCLATFFSADELKGDNMYSCEKCKKLRNGMKYSKVLKLPEILCIHLKRFRHEFMFSSKINSYVSFPLEGLDMGPYLHKKCNDQVTLYDLVAVICHHGTAGGGHYTSYAQNYVNAQWYEFDDQYVTEVDMQQVENCEAYVLFYRKRNEHMMPIRLKAEQIMEVQESTFLQFYVSKQWINKFNTFAEPGPISNNDFLCHHGGVHPHKYSYVSELVQEVPQKLWEYLHDKFGGGPAVNRLYLCDDCQLELDRLKNRQRTEMDTFVKLHEDFQREDYCGQIYAISMSWFKEWEGFVRSKTTEPPGPVDNSKICVVRNSQTVLRMNSDYGQLSQEMWSFLSDIYGGNPELLIKQNRPPSPTPVHKGGSEEESTGAGSKGSEVKA